MEKWMKKNCDRREAAEIFNVAPKCHIKSSATEINSIDIFLSMKRVIEEF